jgi:hypothetical protein
VLLCLSFIHFQYLPKVVISVFTVSSSRTGKNTRSTVGESIESDWDN